VARRHEVRQGEVVASIAGTEKAFPRWETIWEAADNAELRSRRDSPNILNPGDVLLIPEPEIKTEHLDTGKVHRFRVHRSPLWLRIRAVGMDDEPLADEDYELQLPNDVRTGTTDGEGLLEEKIAVDIKSATLRVSGHEFSLRIGHLDPFDTDSGIRGRLVNLGWYPEDGDDALYLASAVEEFQKDEGLKVDGIAGPRTQDKLKKTHGC
jgi:Putative peptidoglycan binding domain